MSAPFLRRLVRCASPPRAILRGVNFLASLLCLVVAAGAGIRAPIITAAALYGAWWFGNRASSHEVDGFIAVLALLAALGLVASLIFGGHPVVIDRY